ncbi:MAG: DciA family protein [Nitrospiraceae bacterium]
MSGPAALTPLASTLSAIARQYGLNAKLLEHRLQRRWSDIVGEQIATHTRPDTIRFRKLYLITENSVWLQQLMFLKPSLLEKINAAAGSAIISDIVLRVGEVGGEAPQVGHKRVNATVGKSDELKPSTELLAEAAGYTQAISDPDLRGRLAAMIAKALAAQGQTKAP